MYGGRAIDSFDRRILTIYMDEYLGDFVFDTFQPFHFFRNKEVDYKIPAGDEKEKFVGEISQASKYMLEVFCKGDRPYISAVLFSVVGLMALLTPLLGGSLAGGRAPLCFVGGPASSL